MLQSHHFQTLIINNTYWTSHVLKHILYTIEMYYFIEMVKKYIIEINKYKSLVNTEAPERPSLPSVVKIKEIPYLILS